jgi:hypothetical protein
MKKSRFTEAQIAFALRQGESGTPVEEVFRKAGDYAKGRFRASALSPEDGVNWKILLQNFSGVTRLRTLDRQENPESAAASALELQRCNP